jgi:O-antigen ligase
MVAEQGIPGGLIFLILVLLTVLYGERIYHETLDPAKKRMVMGMLLAFITIGALNLINDLIEADKVGPFFFIAIAVLVNVDLENKKKSE